MKIKTDPFVASQIEHYGSWRENPEERMAYAGCNISFEEGTPLTSRLVRFSDDAKVSEAGLVLLRLAPDEDELPETEADNAAFCLNIPATARKKALKRIKSLREKTKMPLICELSLAEPLSENIKLQKAQGSIAQTLNYMHSLVMAGADGFLIDFGSETSWLVDPPEEMPPGCFLPPARIAKKYFEEGEQGRTIVIARGRLLSRELIERALNDELCDRVLVEKPPIKPLPERPVLTKKNINGLKKLEVPCVDAREFKPEDARGAEVIVLGGGIEACRTAFALAVEQGAKVRVVAEEKTVMADAEPNERDYLTYYLPLKGVDIYTDTYVAGAEEDRVFFAEKIPAPRRKPQYQKRELRADFVLLAR